MADRHFSAEKLTPLSHWPTWLLIIGYPVYWTELYLFRRTTGETTWLATALFVCVTAGLFFIHRKGGRGLAGSFRQFAGPLSKPQAAVFMAGGLLACVLLAVALAAATLPPHLEQEYDALNYHYTLPRQHLIWNSFAHLPWSSADLFPLPVQFALSPYWFATALLNKWPQFIFLLGLLAVIAGFYRRLAPDPRGAVLAVLAVLGTHGMGVQMGTAMLDIVLCYLLIAALDSFLRKDIWMGAVEASFYLWSKSFIPIQVGLLAVGIAGLWFLVRCALKGRVTLGFPPESPEMSVNWAELRVWGVRIALVSLFVGGPFLAKSLYYSGTPLYPLAAGTIVRPGQDTSSLNWRSLMGAAKDHAGARNAYGHGRSLSAFLSHPWLMAVPEKGVNNAYDYPLGLPFLIFAGPFLIFVVVRVKEKRLPLLPMIGLLLWAVWWMGSQQVRFLFPAVILIYLSVLAIPAVARSRVLPAVLVLALGLNVLSVFRAHRRDLGKPPGQVLRKKDLQIVEQSREYLRNGSRSPVISEVRDVAFARFPVLVKGEKFPFVLAVEGLENREAAIKEGE